MSLIDHSYKPLNKQSGFFLPNLGKKLKNSVEKGGNVGNQYFLLFPESFVPVKKVGF